jgi:hypothetical protein
MRVAVATPSVGNCPSMQSHGVHVHFASVSISVALTFLLLSTSENNSGGLSASVCWKGRSPRTMSLLATLQSYQAPALLLLTIFGPSLLPRLLRVIQRDHNPRRPSRPPRKPLSSTVKLILALHTAWSIYSLLFPPYNIFTTHSLPILAPNDLVRAKVLGQPRTTGTTGTTSPATTSETLTLTEHLLSRLANLDTRYHYARFGHQPLLECLWCQDINDYLLVSIPGIVLPYAVLAVVVGVLGWTVVGGEQAGTRANRWRSAMGWTLVTAGTAEVGVKYLWSVRAVEGDCVHVSADRRQ